MADIINDKGTQAIAAGAATATAKSIPVSEGASRGTIESKAVDPAVKAGISAKYGVAMNQLDTGVEHALRSGDAPTGKLDLKKLNPDSAAYADQLMRRRHFDIGDAKHVEVAPSDVGSQAVRNAVRESKKTEPGR